VEEAVELRMTRRGHPLVLLSVILAGAFGFFLVLAATAGRASAEDSVTSLSTSTTTDLVSADATVSGDGATLSTDTSGTSADATVSGDGATLSTDTSGTSTSVGEPPSGESLQSGNAVDLAGETPTGGSTSSMPSLSSAAVGDFMGSVGPQPRARDIGGFGMTDQGLSLGSEQPGGPNPGAPVGPLSPGASAGSAPSSSASGGPGADAFLAWGIAILLLTLLWNLLTDRSRLSRGYRHILALPG
jgi:hypothetical protein